MITAGGYFEISQGRNIVKGPDGLGWFFEAGLCCGTLWGNIHHNLTNLKKVLFRFVYLFAFFWWFLPSCSEGYQNDSERRTKNKLSRTNMALCTQLSLLGNITPLHWAMEHLTEANEPEGFTMNHLKKRFHDSFISIGLTSEKEYLLTTKLAVSRFGACHNE